MVPGSNTARFLILYPVSLNDNILQHYRIKSQAIDVPTIHWHFSNFPGFTNIHLCACMCESLLNVYNLITCVASCSPTRLKKVNIPVPQGPHPSCCPFKPQLTPSFPTPSSSPKFLSLTSIFPPILKFCHIKNVA